MKFRKGLMILILLNFCLIIILAVILNSNSNGQSNHDYLVGASYMTFWGTGLDIDWSSGAVYWPILGNYSSGNTTIADQHIEWALQYGIDFFFLDYGWATGLDKEKMENATVEGLLKAEGMKNFSFCIFYFPYRVVDSGSVNEATLIEDFSHINETYFSRSNYLRLDNRSVVILADFPEYLDKDLSAKEVNDLFFDLKQHYKLYLIPAFWPDQPCDAFNVLNDSRRIYDAVTLWGSTTIVEFNRVISYSEYINKTRNYFETWSNISINYEVSFVPLICPGYNNTIFYNMGKRDWWAIVNRDPNGFLEACQLARNYATLPHKMVLIFTWNDFKEGTSIEPTEDYDFTYLDAVKAIPEFSSFLIIPLLMVATILAVGLRRHQSKAFYPP
jgi:hypothetical protein